MYHLVTYETFVLGMLLSLLSDIYESQSDGLTPHFLCTFEGISYHHAIHYPLFPIWKTTRWKTHNVSLGDQ